MYFAFLSKLLEVMFILLYSTYNYAWPRDLRGFVFVLKFWGLQVFIYFCKILT